MGRQSEENQKWGERLAYFQAAQEKLTESIKLSKVSVQYRSNQTYEINK
jgi:hypothetical protein